MAYGNSSDGISINLEYKIVEETHDQVVLWRGGFRTSQYVWNRCKSEKDFELQQKASFQCYIATPGVRAVLLDEARLAYQKVEKGRLSLQKKQEELSVAVEAVNGFDPSSNENVKKAQKAVKSAETRLEKALENQEVALQNIENQLSDWRTSGGGYCELTCGLAPRKDYLLDRDPTKLEYVHFRTLEVTSGSQEKIFAKKHPSKACDKIVTDSRTGIEYRVGDMESKAIQKVIQELHIAYRLHIFGDKNGKKWGEPEWKGARDVRSFGGSYSGGSKVSIESITLDAKYAFVRAPKGITGGQPLKIRYHRPIPDEADIKGLRVVRKADGWYLLFCVSLPKDYYGEPDTKPSLENTRGYDPVLKDDVYLACSDNLKIESTKQYREAEEKLAQLQRRESRLRDEFKAAKKEMRQVVGEEIPACLSNYQKQVVDAFRKARNKVSKATKKVKELHQKIARRRKDFAYRVAHRLTNDSQYLHHAIEEPALANLARRNKKKKNADGSYAKNGQSAKSGLAKSIYDASFSAFRTIFAWVAKKKGQKVHEVNKDYTSQFLSYRDEKVFFSLHCRAICDILNRLEVDRDCDSGRDMVRKLLKIFPEVSGGVPVVKKSKTPKSADHFLALARRPIVKVAV